MEKRKLCDGPPKTAEQEQFASDLEKARSVWDLMSSSVQQRFITLDREVRNVADLFLYLSKEGEKAKE